MIILIILIILLVAVIAPNVRIVPQAHCYVIERLGKYACTWDAGLHVKIPVIDRIVRKVSMKEQVLDFPPQPVITKDNVTISIDSVVYAKVFSPKDFCYGVEDALLGLQNITATTLRSLIGDMELDQTLSSRAEINGRMQAVLDEATDTWGLKVSRVELKNIQPPAEIEQVMTKQMRAERDRRQVILESESHRSSVITRSEGDKQAKILAAEAEKEAQIKLAEGRAKAIEMISIAEAASLKRLSEAGISPEVLRLKSLEALKDVSDGQATKIYIPSDLAGDLTKYGLMGDMLGTTAPLPHAKPREELRNDRVEAATKAMLNDDACMNESRTEETKRAAETVFRTNAAMKEQDLILKSPRFPGNETK